ILYTLCQGVQSCCHTCPVPAWYGIFSTPTISIERKEMPDKKVRKMRGPSRPIDPRYAPGPVARRGPDTFGMALIGTSVALVLLIILWAALSNGNNNAATTTVATPI